MGANNVLHSLINLIFGIISLTIKLTFKIVEVIFQFLFGLISGIVQRSDVKHSEKSIKKDASSGNVTENNVRKFKTPESSRAQRRVNEDVSRNKSDEVQNKDFYVVLFILTIIPVIVALSMGKLLYAGIIGAAGFGLMILAGVAAGIAGNLKKKAAEQRADKDEKEPAGDDSTDKLIKDAFDKLFVIRKDIGKIAEADIRKRLEAICCTGEKIIGEVRTNSEGLVHVRKFFYYYIDAFAEIVNKYLRLSSFEESSEEIGRLLTEAENSFSDIDCIFKDMCEKLLQKDIMHLKAEINVIKNSN